MSTQYKRWIQIFHRNFGYTKCPYCGDETEWYNPMRQVFQLDHDNNRRKYCPKCGNRVYTRKGLFTNQPPENQRKRTMEELKKCPFCGGEAFVRKLYSNYIVDAKHDRNCPMYNMLLSYDTHWATQLAAEAAWNRMAKDVD